MLTLFGKCQPFGRAILCLMQVAWKRTVDEIHAVAKSTLCDIQYGRRGTMTSGDGPNVAKFRSTIIYARCCIGFLCRRVQCLMS